MVKALDISECSKVNKFILYVGPHQRLFFKIQMFFLFITALRMVKALVIAECSKVNKCILYVDLHQRPFLKTQNVFYLLLHSEWSKRLAFLSVER